MSVKERILTIRLLKKMEACPAYSKVLWIEATGTVECQKEKPDPKGLTAV